MRRLVGRRPRGLGGAEAASRFFILAVDATVNGYCPSRTTSQAMHAGKGVFFFQLHPDCTQEKLWKRR